MASGRRLFVVTVTRIACGMILLGCIAGRSIALNGSALPRPDSCPRSPTRTHKRAHPLASLLRLQLVTLASTGAWRKRAPNRWSAMCFGGPSWEVHTRGRPWIFARGGRGGVGEHGAPCVAAYAGALMIIMQNEMQNLIRNSAAYPAAPSAISILPFLLSLRCALRCGAPGHHSEPS